MNESNRESSIKPSRKQMSEISFAVWCSKVKGYAVFKKNCEERRKIGGALYYWHSMTAVTNLSE
jgi:hypothetical protein